MDINTSSTITVACNMIVPLCGKIFYGFYDAAIDHTGCTDSHYWHYKDYVEPDEYLGNHPSQARQSLPSAKALRSISCITCRSIFLATLSALPIFSERQ